MPNNITNTIALKGDRVQIKEMLEKIKNDKNGVGTIDFNKIIPMPETLGIETGIRTGIGLKAYSEFMAPYIVGLSACEALERSQTIPKEYEADFLQRHSRIEGCKWELGKAAWQNKQKYGYPTWYEWAVARWGTKWNAYGFGKDYSQESELRFLTAWNAPHPVIAQLSKMFPDIEFIHEWADEDISNNCGRYSYRNGERAEEYFPETETERIAFAIRVMDADPADWGMYLNASGDKFIGINSEVTYDLISLFGKPALFTDARITDSDIPKGLHCFHLRESDDGERFASIEPRVAVNHGGSVIMNEALDFGERGFIPFTEDTEPNFLGRSISLKDFMNGDFEGNEEFKNDNAECQSLS